MPYCKRPFEFKMSAIRIVSTGRLPACDVLRELHVTHLTRTQVVRFFGARGEKSQWPHITSQIRNYLLNLLLFYVNTLKNFWAQKIKFFSFQMFIPALGYAAPIGTNRHTVYEVSFRSTQSVCWAGHSLGYRDLADSGGRAVYGVSWWPLACCNCEFESRRGHECLCCTAKREQTRTFKTKKISMEKVQTEKENLRKKKWQGWRHPPPPHLKRLTSIQYHN